MKTTAALILVLLFSTGVSYPQEQKIKPDETKCLGRAARSAIHTASCLGLVHPATSDLTWRPVLSKTVIASEPQAPDAELIGRIKAEKFKNKFSCRPASAEKSSPFTDPLVGTNYMANTNNNYSPLDNSLAISNGGWIVSVANTTIEYDRTDGSTVFFKNLVEFINDAEITTVCDPVVMYDAGSDRFIFFCQKTPINSQSRILIFFSKTNDPNDGWWYYKLTGNPLNQGEGFDYPKLAVSTNELYITGNLFYAPSLNFDQAILFQIDKKAAYTGASMNWQYWYNIPGKPFTLLPVSHGQGTTYGPGCYLVSTTAAGSNFINFYDLTDDLTGNPSLNHYTVSTAAYSPAGDARQYGTDCKLDNGDCRSLSGFYLNGIIHFVFHCDIGDGWNGINYNRLTVSSQAIQSATFGLKGSYDYSYPSVASFATSSTDKSVMINFGRAGSDIYPSVRVVNCDDAMNWSGSVLVKGSDNYVSYTSQTEERWGDYTGITRHHGADHPSVWISGSYGTGSHLWNAWNAEIHSYGYAVPPAPDAKRELSVSPNPVIETFRIVFSLRENSALRISILGMNGETVRELYDGPGYAGENSFSFNKSGLRSGVYFLVIRDQSNVIKNEKIVISD